MYNFGLEQPILVHNFKYQIKWTGELYMNKENTRAVILAVFTFIVTFIGSAEIYKLIEKIGLGN
ncbi:hypothetical protein ADU80_13305 [Clostridium botulinum]|uniref:Uncharacterized protein n=1 Tax=Clostridium botulinum TaxID=1491 RepID=A0A9Q1ZAJ9_CLOBO|nr:hypothetical protein [Clostridium botulinum]AEB76390.1 putative hypothetical protein [Clostridium botulinum BKT015925]KEI01245.1 hypothetical protein Z953_09030 [Clostridium botulinum D str. 16868]KEI04857.1 hypothetical protein Y848_11990 [Clostridium botulinum C/D str. Sp77]KLU75934.1 hypothetical protein CBC3_06350 [Clostridium botulinum V891]KOA75624.1 hypothetical protein ADU77_10775 [Clostridium botulinum]